MSLAASMVVRQGDFRLEITLEAPAGRTTALLGPNGAGKSTAVSALAGINPIESGLITLSGRVLDDPATGVFVPPHLRRMGLVFQDYVLFPHLSVIENVAFGLRTRGVPHREARARAGEWLAEVGLKGLARARPSQLSGGEAQRVALARALVVEPQLLLLDEPLSALDVSTRVELRRSLARHLLQFEGPRLLITHDPTEAFLLADTIYILEQGAITQAGTSQEIMMKPRTAYAADLVGVNLLTGNAQGGMVRLAGGHSLQVADASMSGPVLATVHPRSIALYRQRPDGSPRNTWPAHVELIEALGDRVRVGLGAPVPLTAEVTSASQAALNLVPGAEVWVAIKATEILVEPGG